MRKRPDPDLPGDENFRPVNGGRVIFPGGRIAMTMTISAEEQAAQHHNLIRYNELGRLRLGMSNRYNESSYR